MGHVSDEVGGRPKLVKKFIESAMQQVSDKSLTREERWVRKVDGNKFEVDVLEDDCRFSYFFPFKPKS